MVHRVRYEVLEFTGNYGVVPVLVCGFFVLGGQFYVLDRCSCPEVFQPVFQHLPMLPEKL